MGPLSEPAPIFFSLCKPASLPLEPIHVCMIPACYTKMPSTEQTLTQGPEVPRRPREGWRDGLWGSTEGLGPVSGSLVLYSVPSHYSVWSSVSTVPALPLLVLIATLWKVIQMCKRCQSSMTLTFSTHPSSRTIFWQLYTNFQCLPHIKKIKAEKTNFSMNLPYNCLWGLVSLRALTKKSILKF